MGEKFKLVSLVFVLGAGSGVAWERYSWHRKMKNPDVPKNAKLCRELAIAGAVDAASNLSIDFTTPTGAYRLKCHDLKNGSGCKLVSEQPKNTPSP